MSERCGDGGGGGGGVPAEVVDGALVVREQCDHAECLAVAHQACKSTATHPTVGKASNGT